MNVNMVIQVWKMIFLGYSLLEENNLQKLFSNHSFDTFLEVVLKFSQVLDTQLLQFSFYDCLLIHAIMVPPALLPAIATSMCLFWQHILTQCGFITITYFFTSQTHGFNLFLDFFTEYFFSLSGNSFSPNIELMNLYNCFYQSIQPIL